jgi:eukaryotic-like serine/threonine-protein kinase
MRGSTPTDVHDYCKLLAKSRLIPADETKLLLTKWQGQGYRDIEDIEGFRKFLVQERQLTEYQSHLVARGHSEGFFLDQYRILDLVGRGRMAGVYKSVHEASGQIVAIKVLPGSKAKDPKTLGRFLREGKLLTQLSHPHIVRAFQVGEANNRHFLVMENLEGETLDDVLARRGKLPIQETIRLVSQILLGLDHIHQNGMIHRDLKPANLMLVDGGGRSDPNSTMNQSIKILDIGLGRTIFDESIKETEPEEQLTATNSMLGTPDYMAPEQARSARDVDIRADLYSVGCVIFRCLVGEPVFPDINIIQQALRHATEAPRSIRKLIPGVSEGLQRVIDRLLAKSPDDRYNSPAETISAFQDAMKAMVDPNPGRPVKVQQGYQDWLNSTGSSSTTSMPTLQAPPISSGGLAESPSAKSNPIPVRQRSTPVPSSGSSSRTAAVGSGKTPVVPPPLPSERIPRPASDYEIDVVSVETSLATINPHPEEPRSLWDIDKRDVIMLATGAFGVLFAILAGYGLSHALKPKEANRPGIEVSTPETSKLTDLRGIETP